MEKYLVKWEIEIEAVSPEEAAFQAFSIQRDHESIAHVYEVNGKEIDIDKILDESEDEL